MSNQPAAEEARGRRRILFVAEAVTLAHLARPVALARSLDPACYDVTLAADPRYDKLLPGLPFRRRPIHSIPGQQFLDALARGRPLYDVPTLRGYVQEDLEVLRETAPDLVVGDFRLSLSVSARLTSTPYLAITNAYWSPYARQRFPLPELPLNRVVGLPVARALFRAVRPLAFALHTRPLNQVRREHGLPSLGLDLRRVYTDADHTLYADVPELIPTFGLPPNHHYLGPVLWSPDVGLPDWWDRVPADRPVVYVTLGTSGQSDLLATVLEALGPLSVSVLAASAGRSNPRNIPGNALVAEFLPGEQAAARARLVVCNGGSLTAQQALAAGTPVLGIATNMDQYLNMEAVCRCGAGALLRAGTADSRAIRDAVQMLLTEPAYRESAARLAQTFATYPAGARFRALLPDVMATPAPPRHTP